MEDSGCIVLGEQLGRSLSKPREDPGRSDMTYVSWIISVGWVVLSHSAMVILHFLDQESRDVDGLGQSYCG